MSVALEALRVLSDVQTIDAVRLLKEATASYDDARATTSQEELMIAVCLKEIDHLEGLGLLVPEAPVRLWTSKWLSVWEQCDPARVARVIATKGYTNRYQWQFCPDSPVFIPLVFEGRCIGADWDIVHDLQSLSEVTNHRVGQRLSAELLNLRGVIQVASAATSAEHELLAAIWQCLSTDSTPTSLSDETLKKNGGLRIDFSYLNVDFSRVGRLIEARGFSVRYHPTYLVPIWLFGQLQQRIDVVEYANKPIYEVS